MGFGLYAYFTKYDDVIVIDTISANAKAGEIYRVPSSELLGLGGYKNTAHEVEVLQMLQLCELSEKKADITVFGIAPQDISSAKVGLSEVLRKRFDDLIEAVIGEIESLGIEARRVQNISLDDIIEQLVSSKRSTS